MELFILENNRQISNKTMKNQDENKNRGNEFYEFIHYIVDLIVLLYIFHFSLSNTYISDPKRDCKFFKLCHMQPVIPHAHHCTRLNFLRHAFFCKSKTDMNLEGQVVLCKPRRLANVLDLWTPRWMFFGKFPEIFIATIF